MKPKTHTSPTIQFHKLDHPTQRAVLYSLTGPQLRDILDAYGIKKSGTKLGLISFILEYTDYAKKTTFTLNTNLADI
jgi:hypothetical protein